MRMAPRQGAPAPAVAKLPLSHGSLTVMKEGVRNGQGMAAVPWPFRKQIVELARAGRSPAELSREFGPSAQNPGNWIAQAARDPGQPLLGKDSLGSTARRLQPEQDMFSTFRHVAAAAAAKSAIYAAGFERQLSPTPGFLRPGSLFNRAGPGTHTWCEGNHPIHASIPLAHSPTP